MRDLNKASVLCCVVLSAIAESLMVHSSPPKNECQTIAECRILNLHIYGFSASFPRLNRDLFCNKRVLENRHKEQIMKLFLDEIGNAVSVSK